MWLGCWCSRTHCKEILQNWNQALNVKACAKKTKNTCHQNSIRIETNMLAKIQRKFDSKPIGHRKATSQHRFLRSSAKDVRFLCVNFAKFVWPLHSTLMHFVWHYDILPTQHSSHKISIPMMIRWFVDRDLSMFFARIRCNHSFQQQVEFSVNDQEIVYLSKASQSFRCVRTICILSRVHWQTNKIFIFTIKFLVFDLKWSYHSFHLLAHSLEDCTKLYKTSPNECHLHALFSPLIWYCCRYCFLLLLLLHPMHYDFFNWTNCWHVCRSYAFI